MEKKVLQNKINEIKGTEKVNGLVSYMIERGYTLEQFVDVKKANKEVVELLNKFFSGEEIAVDKVANGEDINMDNVSDIRKKTRGGKNKKVETVENNSDTGNAENSNTKTGNKIAEGDVVNNEEVKEQTVNLGENQEASKTDNNTEAGNQQDGNGQDIQNNQNQNQNQNNGAGKQEDIPKPKTDTQIAREYKTVHNIVYLAESKHTVLDDVREVTDTGEDYIFSCELSGSELATMFLSGVLVFDPTMQRGLKEDNKGEMIANFKDAHVRNIAEAMKSNAFTPTQIHLGIITDDKDIDWHYNADTNQIAVTGKIRLIDGQHRTRALAKLLNESKVGKLKDVDIDKYVFNVQIHVTNSEHARIIYSNIDKNLKLDKSQVRQLSADHYARIVNALNQHSDSPLKGLIATSKPVGNKLVLFSNLADAIQEVVSITSATRREEIVKYLKDFFDYVAYKLPQAFDEKTRADFRKKNLLNENNAFKMWLKVAFLNEQEYKKNIDHIISNVDYFNKDRQGTVVIDEKERTGHIWLLLTTVKNKMRGEGFAMNNTNTGINAITNQTLELLGGEQK